MPVFEDLAHVVIFALSIIVVKFMSLWLLEKTRLAPMKQTSIPRPELFSAIVIVLAYIRSETRRFKTFVANWVVMNILLEETILLIYSPEDARLLIFLKNGLQVLVSYIITSLNSQVLKWFHNLILLKEILKRRPFLEVIPSLHSHCGYLRDLPSSLWFDLSLLKVLQVEKGTLMTVEGQTAFAWYHTRLSLSHYCCWVEECRVPFTETCWRTSISFWDCCTSFG